ncbi:MAG TPA: DMT family transporter [Thermoanaerobaculia bacterium]
MASRAPAPAAPSPSAAHGPPWQVHAGLLAVQLIFGGFHVTAKAVLTHVDPVALIALRAGLAAPILAWNAWRVDRVLPRLGELPWLALLGLLGVFANQLLFIHGLQTTTATNAAILMPSIPVFAVGLGAVLGIERVGPKRTFGILLAAAGAAVMVNPLRFSLAEGTVVGNLMILGNCLCFAAFLVVQRPVLRRLPWRTVIAGAFVFGGAGVLAVGWRRLAAVDYGALPAGVWWGIAYIVLFPTVLSYSLNTWAVRRSSPSLTAAYTTVQPVATAALAAFFLAERPGWLQAAGFVLIVGGLWVVAKRAEKRLKT